MKILIALLIAAPAYAIDMSQMTAVECESAPTDTSIINGIQLTADVKTSCKGGTGKFCFIDASCLYVDNKVLESTYKNNFKKAFKGEEETFSGNIKNLIDATRGKNPRSIRSSVNIVCYNENNTSCPAASNSSSLLTCLKDTNVTGGNINNTDNSISDTNLSPNVPAVTK